MPDFPKDVESIRQALKSDPQHELSEVASKLIQDSPELIYMWRTLKHHHEESDDLWVWHFLSAAKYSSNLPKYHYKPRDERITAGEELVDLAKQIATKLKASDLDTTLIYSDGKLFDGFFLYEDLTESNQARIDANGTKKLKTSEFIVSVAKWAQDKLINDPIPGKTGTNAAAIRFVRLISVRNNLLYDKPLNKVVTIAANAIFSSNFSESDISNWRNR